MARVDLRVQPLREGALNLLLTHSLLLPLLRWVLPRGAVDMMWLLLLTNDLHATVIASMDAAARATSVLFMVRRRGTRACMDAWTPARRMHASPAVPGCAVATEHPAQRGRHAKPCLGGRAWALLPSTWVDHACIHAWSGLGCPPTCVRVYAATWLAGPDADGGACAAAR